MGNKKTNSQFKSEVFDLVGNEYTVIGLYSRVHDKLKFKHNVCGHTFEMTPHNFLGGQRCPNCRYKRTSASSSKKFDKFSRQVNDITNGEYKVFPPYVNNKTKIKFEHVTCGNIFEMRPNNFTNGQRCPKCGRSSSQNNRRKTAEEFKKEVVSCYGIGEYEVIGDYVDSETKVKVKHNKCGLVYDTRPADFTRGHGCPDCAYNTRSTKIGVSQRTPLSEVKKSIKNILGDEYVVLTKDEDYKGNRQHIIVKHLVCGTEYTPRYSDIQSKHNGCPNCYSVKRSYYEKVINEMLKDNFNLNINEDYYYGYTNSGAYYKGKLHLDFFLPKYNVAIEYDGKQHYVPVKFFGGEDSLKLIQTRDKVKNEYCLQNNISLYRIPYTINHKEEILEELHKILDNYISGTKE